MNLSVVIGYPGAAGEGGRELRRGFCAPGLPLATHNIHRAAEFVGSIRALPSPVSLACTLVHLRQKSSSCCTKVFHFLFPAFAGSSGLFAVFNGLVAAFDRHEGSKREIPNGGKSEARDGNFTAQSRNFTARDGNVPS